MLNRLTVPLLGVLIATFAGCGGSPSPSPTPSASVSNPANVNGTWTGGTTTGGGRTVTLLLEQSGAAVRGNLQGAGTLDGPVEGVVDGNTIRLRERAGFGQTPLLTVRGDEITGIVGGTTLNLRRVR
jgi:hypothetical protein